MNFAIISPTAGLEAYSTRSKTHMVLAHQWVRDREYANFYLKRKKEGDFIFLDNGVYENSYNEDMLLDAIQELRPDVAVLPDVLCRGVESTKASLDFLRKYVHDFPKTQFMFIPQGETITHWRASFKCLPHFLELGSIWLGLTRFLPSHTCKGDPLIRVKLATEVKNAWPKLPIHAMGMADGDVRELSILTKQNFVQSIDSSAPVWRGWLGFDIRNREYWREYGEEVDFAAKPKPEFAKFVEQNLEVVLSACGGTI